MLHSVGYVRPSHCTRKQPEVAVPEPYKEPPSKVGKVFEILRVRNRFAMKEGEPHWSGGFRNLTFKVKVGYQVPAVDAVSSSAFRTGSTLQRCACRSHRAEYRSLCQCITSCLHTAVVAALYLLSI
jgi:hypothetical protein